MLPTSSLHCSFFSVLVVLVNAVEVMQPARARNVGIKQLVIGGENEDWKIPDMQLPKVRNIKRSHRSSAAPHACTCLRLAITLIPRPC